MRMTRFTTIIVAAVLLLALPGKTPLLADSIKWQVVSSGGGQGTSPTLKLSGTVGQTGTRTGTDGTFKLVGGFWQDFTVSAGCNQCGDANSDGAIDISDVVFIIAYIFAGGSAPEPCGTPTGKGDADGSGSVDISDAVYLISFIFSGGSAPHCP